MSKIEDLQTDLKNGVKLCQLGEILASKKLRYDLTPRMKIQAIQNINTGLQVIQADLRVRLLGIGAEDIYGGNLKLILGLIFSTFRSLRDSLLANELGEGAVKGSEAQQLIAWVQRQVEPQPYALKVADWSDFRDGKAFSALLNIYDNDYLSWDAVGENGEENLARAFKGFEEHLDIPQLIDPKEVAAGTADERSLTLYTSLIYHAHATNAEKMRLQREARERENELNRQRQLLEAQSKDMGGELERLRGDNQRLLERALLAEEMARKAFSALDVLKKNLLEHLDDLGHWRELMEVDIDPSKLSVYDVDKVNANLRGRTFENQVMYLSDSLQAENRTLTRILRVKDSKRDIEETVFKSDSLFMKTEKNGPWVVHHFKLFAEDLAYYADDKAAARLGAVSLKEPETSVILLKPEQADGEQVYPIKLKLKSGMQFYVATLSKKDRKDWAAIINGRITHFSYLAVTEEQGVRPDPRVINLATAPADCPSVYLDNGELSDESLSAVGDILPFLENVNVVSFANTDLSDADVTLLGEGLGKSSVHVLKFCGNNLTDEGAKQLANVLAANRCLDELDVSGNKISDEGAAALAGLFSAKHPITSLNVQNNRVGDAGVTAICAALKAQPSVPVLQFSQNNISDVGVAAIASLIKANASILEVHLGNNSITDAGVAVLCEALKVNQSVLKVDLKGNSIGPAGVASLHQVFKQNKVVRDIDVSHNEITEGAALAASLADESISVSSLAFSRFRK